MKLSLTISEEDVRLITGRDDLYRWSGFSGIEHFFTKQLSKYCLRFYIEIYYLINNFFKVLFNNTIEKEKSSSNTLLKCVVSSMNID